MTGGIRVVPANKATWDDIQAILGERGYAAACQCQRFKLGPHGWTSATRAERAANLREQTNCGRPRARRTSGLVAYLDGEPVGWCDVEPRPAFPRLLQKPTAWRGRDEDPQDESVWAVTCFITRAGYRRRG